MPLSVKKLKPQMRQFKKEVRQEYLKENVSSRASASENQTIKVIIPTRGNDSLYLDQIQTASISLRHLYGKTFEHWRGANYADGSTSPKALSRPVIQAQIQSEVEIKGNKIIVRIGSTAIGADKKPHPIWYWLDQGVNHTLTKRSAVFPVRNGRRTSPNTLSVRPFSGFVQETVQGRNGQSYIRIKRVSLPAGHKLQIEERRWSEKIGEETVSELNSRFPKAKVHYERSKVNG